MRELFRKNIIIDPEGDALIKSTTVCQFRKNNVNTSLWKMKELLWPPAVSMIASIEFIKRIVFEELRNPIKISKIDGRAQ